MSYVLGEDQDQQTYYKGQQNERNDCGAFGIQELFKKAQNELQIPGEARGTTQ